MIEATDLIPFFEANNSAETGRIPLLVGRTLYNPSYACVTSKAKYALKLTNVS